MIELFANSGDPDQMPRSAASDLGLHCLPITLFRVSGPQWVREVDTLFSQNTISPTTLFQDFSTFRYIRISAG